MIEEPSYSICTDQHPPANGWYKAQLPFCPWRYRYYRDGKWFYVPWNVYHQVAGLKHSTLGVGIPGIWAFLNEDDKKIVPLNVRFENEA